jgi:hypothetical protein
MNWGKGEGLARLTKAVNDWVNGSDECFRGGSGKRMPFTDYAATIDIPFNTLRKFISQDGKRLKELGKSQGRPTLLDEDCSQFVADVVVRCDRGNDGKTPSELIDVIEDLKPDLSRKQISDSWNRTGKQRHLDQIKPNPVKAQATTTKRCAITVGQQYRWFKTYDGAIQFLREHNKGVCRKTGKLFGELIEYFISAGDETCILACDGQMMIVGSADRKKHEKNTSDSRTSITMYRTGVLAGNTGPTGFRLAGKK